MADEHLPRPVTAKGESDCARVTVIAPPGTDPGVVLEMAEKLAANAHLLLGEPRLQCCPMDTYDTDSGGNMRAVCTCDDDCSCACTGCACAFGWDDDG